MKIAKVDYIKVFFLTGLFFSSWYLVGFEIGGRTVLTIPEFFLLGLLTYILIKGYSVAIPKNIRRILFLFLIIGTIFFIYSLIIGLRIGPSVGSFRSLFIDPILGIIVGASLSKVKYSKTIFSNAFYLMLGVSIILAILNLITGFYPLTDYALITRVNGILLALLLFYHLHLELSFKGINKVNKLYIILLILLIFFSGSRGVYISVIGGIALLLLYHFNWKAFLKTSSVGIIAIIVFVLIYTVPSYQTQINKKVQQLVDVTQGDYGSSGLEANSVGMRYFRYISAYKIGSKKPITGHGLGFKPEGFYYGGAYDRFDTEITAHNYFLTIWMKLGFLGLVTMGVFLYRIYCSIHSMPFKIFLVVTYAYSLVDVMMVSNDSAICAIYFIIGFAMSVKEPLKS